MLVSKEILNKVSENKKESFARNVPTRLGIYILYGIGHV